VEPPATTRLKLTVHYDGSDFHGWQLQPDRRTVQGELESCLSRLADSPRRVTGSGRTDTGVHATGQVASVDMPERWTPEDLRGSLNAVLAHDVWIESVETVGDDFHPRYDAVARTYTYHIGTSPAAASPFRRRWCWPLGEEPDRRLLRAATAVIVGEHSFRAFCKAGQSERGDRCTVASAAWTASDDGVVLSITADRYLHHMVRYLVGTTVAIGRGRRPPEDMARLLGGDPDVVTSPPAPAQGLFLRRVEYPVRAAPDIESQPQTTARSAAPA
jgi:tRNA pseudouridine38-40 synthase